MKWCLSSWLVLAAWLSPVATAKSSSSSSSSTTTANADNEDALVPEVASPVVVNEEVTEPDDPNDNTPFLHFVAHNSTMTCTDDGRSRPFNMQIRGVNLGGWMALEPWITPSLFYQFLGGNETTTAFDTYTFCEVLGAKEANRQLRIHW
jgi:hypothetical protein